MSDNIQNNYKYPADLPIPKRPWWQRFLAIAIILTVLLAGFAIAQYLLATTPKAKRKPPVKMQTLVKTTTLAPVSINVKIKALGLVGPAREVNLQAQVSGRTTYLHPDLEPGGIINKDEVVVRIENIDYRLQLQHKRNIQAQAQADLRLEEGNQLVARQEWQMIIDEGIDIGEANKDLALRKPQLDKVLANINVAATETELAQINLDRTELKAPFNSVVRQKNVEIGSQISSQSTIAVLAGIDTFWAEISVPVEQLQWLVLPEGQSAGSKVTVYSNGKTIHQGSLLKLLPDVDKDGLMARLLIAIPDPLGLKSKKTPLLLGSFIRAEIEGRRLENVFQVSRAALLDGNQVLTISPENTLHIQPVTVVWKNSDFIFIDKGLKTGDRIIISKVPAPIEGMALEVNGQNLPKKLGTPRLDKDS